MALACERDRGLRTSPTTRCSSTCRWRTNFGRLMHLIGARAGFTTAFCPDPLRVAEAMPRRAADACCRACRGSTRRCTRRSSASSSRCTARGSACWTGRCASAGRVSELRQAGRPVPLGPAAPAPSRRPARLQQGEGQAGRAAAPGHLRRCAAREGDRRVLPRARHPRRRGLGPDGVHDGRFGQPTEPLSFRHRWPRAPRLRWCARTRTASC